MTVEWQTRLDVRHSREQCRLVTLNLYSPVNDITDTSSKQTRYNVTTCTQMLSTIITQFMLGRGFTK